MQTHSAETLALQALAWLAADTDRLSRLMAATGLSPDDLRSRASDPVFLRGLLEHLLGDEPSLLAFAADADRPPEDVLRAVVALGGQPSW